jgi:hypothetical protein
MSILLLESEEPLTAEMVKEVSQKHHQSSEICWNETHLPSPFQWMLICDPSQLWFCSTIPFPMNGERESDKLSYLEGLWERDVVELFLLDSKTGKYLEFNFCPINAWWSCEFECYRAPSSPSPRPPQLTSIEFQTGASSWSVTAAFALPSLPFTVGPSTLAHISGIAQNPSEPVFLTSNIARSDTYDPDFHRLASFLALEILPLRGEFR